MVKEKIQSVQYLRACSALIVLLCHYFSGLNIFRGGVNFTGRFGVAFFFVISGYFLANPSSDGLRNYWKKKIIRIVPLYWASTFLVYFIGLVAPSLLHTADPTVENLLKSLFFIPFYTDNVSGIFPLYPITWTLTCEVYVYLIFWIAQKILKKNALSCLVTACIIIIVSILGSVYQGESLFLETYGQSYVAFFAIGIFFKMIEQRIPLFERNKLSKNRSVGWITAVIGFTFLAILSVNYSETIGYFIIISTIFLIVITLLRMANFPKLFVHLGDISYSFYLIHYFIVKGFTRIILKGNPINLFTSFMGLIFCIIVTYVIACVSWNLIEVKLSRLLKKCLMK